MDSAASDRPQCRTALVGRELGRCGIQIAALSETRFADVGEIKEVGAGYTFFWNGRKSKERREASPLKTLASYRLCHSAENRQGGCQSGKNMCGADCWTDHNLVVSKLNLRIQPARRPQGKKAPKIKSNC